MRVVFFGTPEVAVPALEELLASRHEVAGVVTQPDRARGRGKQVSASPVKQLATERGIARILQPDTPKQDGFADELRALAPDALAVVAYGHILPVAVLEVAPALNAHFSLLPAYRGAAPVQRALMDGATVTGVSVFLLEPTVDTGPVVRVERVDIGPEETTGELLGRLAPVGARLLAGALDDLEAGVARPQPQDTGSASLAPKIKPEESRIDWSQPAGRIAGLVRALNPRPGAHATFRGKRLIIHRARPAEGTGEPGVLIAATPDGPVVGTGDGGLLLVEVQPEGKRAITGAEFARGYRPEPGDLF
jgi:methionyl-tRNA formyltransferase